MSALGKQSTKQKNPTRPSRYVQCSHFYVDETIGFGGFWLDVLHLKPNQLVSHPKTTRV